MSVIQLKPDLKITAAQVERDYVLTFLLCLSVIGLAVAAWVLDWNARAVFTGMAIVAFLFLGQKKDLPNDQWSPQQKASWTKRFTTLKVKDGCLVYVYGDGPNSADTYGLESISLLQIKGNKLHVHFDDGSKRKISTKFWPENDVQSFVQETNKLLQANS